MSMLLPQDSSEGSATPLRLPRQERAPAAGRSESRSRRLGAWQVAGDLPASFRYAAQGLAYGFLSQRNFRIHVITGAVVFGMGLWLGLSTDRLAVLVLTVAAVLVLELLNTATEAVVDLAIGRRFHPLARIAKDCAAAAVLVAALSSLLIAGLLLVPPLLNRLGH
ncbi:diacylglycerol kinase family protein [Cyanobium sp. FGCU-52]|nr:diacylglycerol kinase family protein [Cyanobium sp. FGCU52]